MDDNAPKCAKCGAQMNDYDAIYDRDDADPKRDIPDYAKCKQCGKMHHVHEG